MDIRSRGILVPEPPGEKRGWARRITELRSKLSMNQTAFAAALGTRQNNISRWEQGVNRPTPEAFVRMAEVAPAAHKEYFLGEAGIDNGFLETFREASNLISAMGAAAVANRRKERQAKRAPFVDVPLVTGRSGAGPAYFHDADEIEGHVCVPSEMCPNPSSTKCVRIAGDSMEPTIADGTVVAVDSSQRHLEKLRGKIVAVRHETDGVKVKRLILFEGRDVLASEKQGHPTFDLSPEWEIVGRVIWWLQMA